MDGREGSDEWIGVVSEWVDGKDDKGTWIRYQGMGEWMRWSLSHAWARVHFNTHTHPAGSPQVWTYPAPVEDGGRLQNTPSHVCHLIFHHDSKFTNIWVCIETCTSHLEEGKRERWVSGGHLCSKYRQVWGWEVLEYPSWRNPKTLCLPIC